MRLQGSRWHAGYLLGASGHNPRPTRADLAKRWFYDKLSYSYHQRNSYHGCVGRGRRHRLPGRCPHAEGCLPAAGAWAKCTQSSGKLAALHTTIACRAQPAS